MKTVYTVPRWPYKTQECTRITHIFHLTCMYHVYLSLCMCTCASRALIMLIALSIINECTSPLSIPEECFHNSCADTSCIYLDMNFSENSDLQRTCFILSFCEQRKCRSSRSPYPQLGVKESISAVFLFSTEERVRRILQILWCPSSWDFMLMLDTSRESLNTHSRLQLPSVRDHELFLVFSFLLLSTGVIEWVHLWYLLALTNNALSSYNRRSFTHAVSISNFTHTMHVNGEYYPKTVLHLLYSC